MMVFDIPPAREDPHDADAGKRLNLSKVITEEEYLLRECQWRWLLASLQWRFGAARLRGQSVPFVRNRYAKVATAQRAVSLA